MSRNKISFLENQKRKRWAGFNQVANLGSSNRNKVGLWHQLQLKNSIMTIGTILHQQAKLVWSFNQTLPLQLERIYRDLKLTKALACED